MGKKIDDWLSRPLYIYGFGLFFLIYKSALYFPSFEPLIFICFFVTYCLINFCIIRIQKKTGLSKYGFSWLILTWALLLFIGQVVDFLSKFIDESFIHFRYLFLFNIILCLIMCLINKRIETQKIQKLNPVFNVFTFILIGVTILSGIRLDFKEQKHLSVLADRKLPPLEIKNNNDLIWILLDEYAAPSSLKSQFKFHNSLVDSLTGKGFFVFDKLHSRSDATLHSVNSLFNLDDSIPRSNYNYAANYLNQSIWIKHLQKLGYEFVNLDFLNIGMHPKFSYLGIFPDNYMDQILTESVFTILSGRISEKNMLFDNYNQKVINAFKINVNKKRSKPVFIWTHLLIPHKPFYRDANGNINKSPVFDLKASSPSVVSSQYTGYLNYGNKVVLEMLNEIPDWKNKTIIISGDHGARMLIPDNDPRRKQTFGAIYYPGMDKKGLSKIEYMQQIPFHLH